MANSGTSSNLILNIIPFEHPQKVKVFGFYQDKEKGRGILRRHEFSPELKKKLTDAQQLYTDFGAPEETDIKQEIDLTQSTNFAGHYYNHQLYKAMRGKAAHRRRNFINSNQFWFRDESKDTAGFQSFKKIVVKATVDSYTKGPGLRVMYDGHSLVMPQAMTAYNGPTTDLNYLLYQSHCFRYNDIPPHVDIDFNKAYPVVNYRVLNHLNKTLPPNRSTNKVKKYFEHVDSFREQFILSADIQQLFPVKNAGQWLPVKRKQVFKIPGACNELTFFKRKTHKLPFRGIYKYGPYRRPGHKHIRVFFMMHEAVREKQGARLYRIMTNQVDGIQGLRTFTKTPMDVTDKHIKFKNAANPFPEIAEQLRTMPFEEEVRYLGIYISPISKNEQDEDKYQVYFKIKEELLKYGIVSQTVEQQKIDDPNFKYYMPNIATAITAKLGGVPWQLDNPPEPELIVGVGVGAFKPAAMNNRYVGNAFCFSNKGEFYGFECYVEDETTMLAGSIRKAVRTYVEEHGDIERLIIHYYKQMSYQERKPIMNMLHNLGLDISVIVVSINKTESRDMVVFDAGSAGKMPVSGINVRVGYKTHLLCNNTRYYNDSKKLHSYPFPVKLRISAPAMKDNLTGKDRARLIQQVYQFSRIYWKSVSQQSLPVTVKYPEMVARMVPYFESLDMPPFAKETLWFL